MNKAIFWASSTPSAQCFNDTSSQRVKQTTRLPYTSYCMRNPSFTILKAIAIILVVIAHSAAPTYLSSFAYMVGVPAFFVLSGYFFKQENLDNTSNFLIRRTKTLYLPFIKWGVFFLILHNLFFEVGFLSESYGNAQGGVTHHYNWTQAAQHLWSMVFNMSGYDPFMAGAFWFFRALFLANIAFIFYADGEKRYILAPKGLKVGQKIMSGTMAALELANALPLESIPVGFTVHNVELTLGKGGQMARSAGAAALIAAKEGDYVTLRLPSGETRLVHKKCYATIGEVGNADHMNINLGKAGRARWRGIRPSVRGMAMNPVDHPLGGGEGRGKGRNPVTPWGQPCKGYKTRKKKNTSDRFIVSRRK